MPAKGQKLTEEHKKAMQEGRQKWLDSQEYKDEQAEIKASKEEERKLNEEHEKAKAKAQEEAIEKAKEARRAMVEGDVPQAPKVPDPPTHAPTHVPAGSDDGVQEWGPYRDYQIVATPYGNYAVEPGYVMFFESYQFFDDREKRMRTSQRPVHYWHGKGEPVYDDDGNLISGDKDYGKLRDELVRGFRPGERRPPKISVPTS